MCLWAHKTKGGIVVEGFSAGKSDRLLQIYSRLVGGEILRKGKLAQRFGVTEKSIQRDMDKQSMFILRTPGFRQETPICK